MTIHDRGPFKIIPFLAVHPPLHAGPRNTAPSAVRRNRCTAGRKRLEDRGRTTLVSSHLARDLMVKWSKMSSQRISLSAGVMSSCGCVWKWSPMPTKTEVIRRKMMSNQLMDLRYLGLPYSQPHVFQMLNPLFCQISIIYMFYWRSCQHPQRYCISLLLCFDQILQYCFLWGDHIIDHSLLNDDNH